MLPQSMLLFYVIWNWAVKKLYLHFIGQLCTVQGFPLHSNMPLQIDLQQSTLIISTSRSLS